MEKALVKAFWDRVLITTPDECWEWTGYRMPPLRGKGPRRYGKLNRSGISHYAHRLSFEIAYGAAPSGHVLHSCDNMACVNPAHLREGTNLDNVRDRESRKRSGDRRGSNNNHSKLTERDVIEMRKLFVGGKSSVDLAKQYGVNKSTAYSAIAGYTWSHVPMVGIHSGQVGEDIIVRSFDG